MDHQAEPSGKPGPEPGNAKPRIAYAVAGQGRGHAAKSLALYEMLIQHYEVRFFAGGEALDFFRKKNLAVTEIPCPRFHLKDNAIQAWATIRMNLPLVRGLSGILKEIREALTGFGADLVLSDFETFVPRAANKLGIPVIQISHQVVLLACRFPVPAGQRLAFQKAYWMSRILIGRFRYAIGVSFFPAPVATRRFRDKVAILPPIFRSELENRRADSSGSGPVLIYFSCPTFAWLFDLLLEHPNQEFIVYGLEPGNRILSPNVTVKPISPITFPRDMLGARAIITDGGHNLISEAFYLGLPVLSFWIEGQFEQYLNATFVESLGLGRMVRNPIHAQEDLAAFLVDLNAGRLEYPTRLESGNQAIFNLAHKLAREWLPRKSPAIDQELSVLARGSCQAKV